MVISFHIRFEWPYAILILTSLLLSRYFTFLPQAIETFKECGKKDNKMAGTAATNLSFIYFMVS